MASRLLKGKQILAVDDEPEVLDTIEEELLDHGALPDRASSYEEAIQKISSLTYDLLILDIMGVRGFELLEHAVARKIPVVMLTGHELSPGSLKRSIELGARAYLPKDQLGRLAPFLEDALFLSYHSAWKSALARLDGSLGIHLGSNWLKSEREFWEQFEKDLEVSESTIIE